MNCTMCGSADHTWAYCPKNTVDALIKRLQDQNEKYRKGLERIAFIKRATYTNPWSAVAKMNEIATDSLKEVA